VEPDPARDRDPAKLLAVVMDEKVGIRRQPPPGTTADDTLAGRSISKLLLLATGVPVAQPRAV